MRYTSCRLREVGLNRYASDRVFRTKLLAELFRGFGRRIGSIYKEQGAAFGSKVA
jgi:hypothetical protein